MIARIALLLGALLILGAGVWQVRHSGSAEGRLEGSFFTGGPIDEGDLAPGDSHFYVWLEGEAARALYERLPGEPEPEVCENGFAWVRTNGRSIVCNASGDSTRYACYFALDIVADSLASGASC